MPFFGFDGCHLKRPFGGILLVSTGVDANIQLFPTVVGIFEIENKRLFDAIRSP